MKYKKFILLFILLSIFLFVCFNGYARDTISVNSDNNVLGTAQIVERSDLKKYEFLDVFPLKLIFSSGAGGWRTSITLNKDGSFTGEHTDSEIGESDITFLKGTVYICEFSGHFDEISEVDQYTYTMTLSEVSVLNKENEEWIENEIRYVVSEPYGLETGEKFILYTPETPIEGLDTEFISWWPKWYYTEKEESPQMLSCYGLYNQEMGYGFFSYE